MNATDSQTQISDHSDYTKTLIITIILSIFSVFGTTGNAFVLYVFSRKKEKNTSTIFILTLATVDFLTCLIVIPFTIVVEYAEKRTNDDLTCKLYSFLITCSVPFSAFIMVAIAFDRYFCICRPWTRLLDAKCAKRIIVVLLLFVISLGIMTALIHGVYKIELEQVNRTVPNDYNYSASSNTFFNRTLMENEMYRPDVNVSLDRYQFWDYKKNQIYNITTSVTISRKIFTGYCLPNEILIGASVKKVYQTFYISLFVIALVSVSVLYGLIYKSILIRRKRRLEASGLHKFFCQRKQTYVTSMATGVTTEITDKGYDDEVPKNKTDNNLTTVEECTEISDKQIGNDIPLKTINTPDSNHEEGNQSNNHTISNTKCKRKKTDQKVRTFMNCTSKTKEVIESFSHTNKNMSPSAKKRSSNDNESTETGCGTAGKSVTVYRKDTRKSVRERHRIANIKTAGILFIVTVVFILAFLPAWLMATKLISPDIVVFYMHFSYNVANPIIYAFFNNSFQKEVRQALRCRR